MPFETLEMRRADRKDIIETLHKYLGMTPNEIMDACRNPSIPAVEALIAAILVKSIRNGDYQPAQFLFDRAYGKMVEMHAVATAEVQPDNVPGYRETMREMCNVFSQLKLERK